jgi:hypothetical protein
MTFNYKTNNGVMKCYANKDLIAFIELRNEKFEVTYKFSAPNNHSRKFNTAQLAKIEVEKQFRNFIKRVIF